MRLRCWRRLIASQVQDEIVPRNGDSSVVDLSAFFYLILLLPSSSVPDTSKAIPSASKRSSTVKEAMSSEKISFS